MKPPRRAEPNGRIVAGQRSELPAVGRFVEGEENQREHLFVTIRVQEWAKIACKLRGDGNIAAPVRAEARKERFVVIPERAGVELHNEAVVGGHPCHRHEKMGFPAPLVSGRRLSGRSTLKQSLGVAGRQRLGERLEHAVIGRGRAQALEERASLGERDDQLLRAVNRPGARRGKSGNRVLPRRRRQAKHGVRAERRNHAAVPTRPLDRRVVLERIARPVGGGEHLDVEAVEERARPELGRGEPLGDGVIGPVGIVGVESIDVKQLGQLLVEPESGRRATEHVVMPGE